MVRHIGLAFAALASLAATSVSAQSQDDTIAYTSRKAQPLVAGSSFRNVFLFGAVGGFVADRIDGNLIAKESDVLDPQGDIAFAVASEIAQRRGVDVADGPVDVRGLSRRALARNPPPARFLIDVESTQREFMWSLIRGQWIRYTVGYKANLAVLDIPNQEYVVRDRCRWSSPKSDRYSRARLLDNDAEHLKLQFAVAADACTAQFVDATQGLWSRDARQARDDQAFADDHVAYRAPPPPPVRMAPLPADTRAEPVYAPPPPPARVEYRRPASPVVVEYPYGRPYEAPPARAAEPRDSRHAGRDANGYLTWSGKRP